MPRKTRKFTSTYKIGANQPINNTERACFNGLSRRNWLASGPPMPRRCISVCAPAMLNAPPSPIKFCWPVLAGSRAVQYFPTKASVAPSRPIAAPILSINYSNLARPIATDKPHHGACDTESDAKLKLLAQVCDRIQFPLVAHFLPLSRGINHCQAFWHSIPLCC